MEIEKDLSKKETIVLLRQLADALESNQTLQIDGEFINFPDTLDVSLEFEQDGDESELEIEINWSKTERLHTGKFEIFEGRNGKWYFHLKASNGKTILSSEGYASKQGAKKGIKSIKKNATEKYVEYRTSKANQPYFVLKAANGEIIGMSQMYKRQTSCQKGAQSVIKHALDAEVTTPE